MKKKKILFTSLLLLIIAIPLSLTFGNIDGNVFKNFKNLFASASTVPGYEYHWKIFTAQDIYGAAEIPRFRVGSSEPSYHSR